MHLVAIGGSDAGISAALRARELDPNVDVTVIVADLEATGMRLRLDTFATSIDVAGRKLAVRTPNGDTELISYDELMVGTGALPSFAGITGLAELGPDRGVHVLHSMGDTFALEKHFDDGDPRSAIIIGAGYVGLEMAEGLTMRGIHVTQLQRSPEVLSPLDPELGSLVHMELLRHGVDVLTDTTVNAVTSTNDTLTVTGIRNGEPFSKTADLVLAVVGVNPNTSLLAAAGATLGAGNAVVVDETMRTGLPNVWAAGDGVVTHHQLLGTTYLPLGTTAHKQGRIAGENALGGDARFAGILGTQVVKVFDLVAARTGLREHEVAAAGLAPLSTTKAADDHKAYYPGAKPISIRITGDHDGRLLGAQLVGSYGTEVAKRVDTFATAIHHGMTVAEISDLDLSYTPPLGSPWDVVQVATQAWTRQHLEAGR